MAEISLGIELAGQKQYDEAVEKYGQEFADAVVAQELQLYADNLDCFDEYAKYDWMQCYLENEI